MGKKHVTTKTKVASATTWFLFAAGSVGFGAMLWVWGPPAAVLDEGGVTLPAPSLWLTALAVQLRTALGLAIGIGAVVLLSLPLFFGARGSRSAKFYGALAAVTLLATAASWWFLARVVRTAQEHFGA